MKIKLMTALSTLLLAVGQVYALAVSSGEIKLGEWNTRTIDALEYAKKTNIPLLIFRANNGCSRCAQLEEACAKDNFIAWQKERQMVMVFNLNDNSKDYLAGREELTPDSVIASGSMPKIAFYWKKADGSVFHKGFVGRAREFPGQDYKLPLEIQLMNVIDSYLGTDYKPATSYNGGMFKVRESAGHRYEATAETESIKIKINRNNSAKGSVATNTLTAVNANGKEFFSKVIVWGANDLNKTESVNISENPLKNDGEKLTLYFKDAAGKTVDTNYVHFASPENSVKNPLWLGKPFDFGEWTMDFVAATNKQSLTLVAVTGALWCPDCKRTDENFLDLTDTNGENRFRQWAKSKNINLVTVDVPNFKSEKATAESPTLLSRDPYTASLGEQSGLAYLTRNEVSDDAAKRTLERNHQLVSSFSATSLLRRPEDKNLYRTGVPIFVLLRADGTVAARLTYLASKSPVEEDRAQWDNIIKRFDEMVEISKIDGVHFDDVNNNHFSTTKESLKADRDTVSGEISHVDSLDVFKLEGVSGGVTQNIKVSGASSAMVKVELIDDNNTLTNAVKTGKLSDGIELETVLPNGNYFVRISAVDLGAGEFSVKNATANNFFTYKIESSLVIIPREMAAAATANSEYADVLMKVTSGVRYRITGLSSDAQDGLKVVSDGLYEGTKSATCLLKLAQNGGSVTYQIWNPGTVGFSSADQRLIEVNKTGSVKVARIGGSSGETTVKVTLTKNLAAGRLEKPTAEFELTWKDGEIGEKTIDFAVKADSTYQPTDTFVMTLSAGATCAATLTSKTHTVTVIDTDKPILDQVFYNVRLFMNFDANIEYPVNNIFENGRVTVKKISGKLPSGIRVKYDSKKNAIVFSGKARNTVKGQNYSFTISERRAGGLATGLETTFVIDVVDPKKLSKSDPGYNGVVGYAMEFDLPIYAPKNGRTVLAGMLDLSVRSNNRISAKLSGIGSRKINFSGYWQGVDDGTAFATLETRKGEVLNLELSNDGLIFASFENVKSDFGSELASDPNGTSVIDAGTFNSYAGYYTVTLPANTEELLTAGTVGTVAPLGTGYLTLKMESSGFARTGRVSYTGKYADDARLSGSAYLVPNAYADGSAQLCIMKRSTKNSIGLVLKIKPNAAATYETDPMAILSDEKVIPYWRSSAFGVVPVNVYGGYYDNAMDLLSCCAADYNTEWFTFAGDLTGVAPSLAYGSIVEVPPALATVSATSLILKPIDNAKITMRFTKRTGVASGKLPIRFANGKEVTASFYGVLLPHWYDCGCGDGTSSVITRPFFSGFAVYPDVVNGKRLKRSFAVDLNPIFEVK